MKKVTRDEFLLFYIFKPNIKAKATLIKNLMYYKVFQDGVLIAKSETKDFDETKYYINDKQS